jgi:hypothetical protein
VVVDTGPKAIKEHRTTTAGQKSRFDGGIPKKLTDHALFTMVMLSSQPTSILRNDLSRRSTTFGSSEDLLSRSVDNYTRRNPHLLQR